MFPVQEITVLTKNGRKFAVHLNKEMPGRFECEVATIDATSPFSPTFTPSSWGITSEEAFRALVALLVPGLSKLTPADAIIEVDNPNNTELLSANQQRSILGGEITVKVNGADAK